MSIRIIKAGVLDTIQDKGRFGFRHLGINTGGAMDAYAAQIANCLTGNEMNEAVMELHFPSAALFFEQTALIAISGADFSPCVNGDPVPCLRPILLSRFSILQFERVKQGARAYVSVYGGMNTARWLNSASANLKTGMTGLTGEPLRTNDEIPVQPHDLFSKIVGKREFIVLPWQADDNRDNAAGEIMILPGPEWDRLDRAAQHALLNTSFTISNQSDRMGYRLTGTSLATSTHEEMISAAVSFGTIQLLPDGQLIVLMADHQATGGYPRIAHVISAHHSRLAQARPGDNLRFLLISQGEAEDLLIKQRQHLLQLQNACKFRLEEYLFKCKI